LTIFFITIIIFYILGPFYATFMEQHNRLHRCYERLSLLHKNNDTLRCPRDQLIIVK